MKALINEYKSAVSIFTIMFCILCQGCRWELSGTSQIIFPRKVSFPLEEGVYYLTDRNIDDDVLANATKHEKDVLQRGGYNLSVFSITLNRVEQCYKGVIKDIGGKIIETGFYQLAEIKGDDYLVSSNEHGCYEHLHQGEYTYLFIRKTENGFSVLDFEGPALHKIFDFWASDFSKIGALWNSISSTYENSHSHYYSMSMLTYIEFYENYLPFFREGVKLKFVDSSLDNQKIDALKTIIKRKQGQSNSTSDIDYSSYTKSSSDETNSSEIGGGLAKTALNYLLSGGEDRDASTAVRKECSKELLKDRIMSCYINQDCATAFDSGLACDYHVESCTHYWGVLNEDREARECTRKMKRQAVSYTYGSGRYYCDVENPDRAYHEDDKDELVRAICGK